MSVSSSSGGSTASNTTRTCPTTTLPPPVLDRMVWHRKSKQGCRTCKIRKVKCDETRPLCRNCARRFPGIESCDFARPPTGTSTSNTSVIPQSINCRPNHVHESNKLRVMELRLMYHYTRTVHTHLPHYEDPRTRIMWEVDIPQVAFGSDVVLNAVMALSALHLRMLSPNDSELMYAAGHYFGQAVRKYRPSLANLTADMAEPILITAMIITYYTWLVSYSPNPGVPYQLPLQSFFLLRGVFDLLREVGPWIKSPNFQWLYVPPVSTDPTIQPTNYFLALHQQDKDRFLRTCDENTTLEDKEVYIEAFDYLSSICNALTGGVPPALIQRKISYFVPRLPRRFLDLLGRKDPRAMALMARDLSLLKLVDWAWWLHGAQGMAVEEYHVRGICELMPIEWLWAMDWPLRVACGRLNLDIEEPLPVISNMLPSTQLVVRASSKLPPVQT